MAEVRSHRDLIVWQKAMDLAVEVFKLTERFPKSQVYGLTAQVTRSAASVAANIAEGSARGSSADYARFLAIAKGSLAETETFLQLAVRLRYVEEQNTGHLLDLVEEISKMIAAIRAKLKG